MTRLRALLASLRIANAPSVVSNVWLGFMLGWFWWGGSPFEEPWGKLGALCAIGLVLYLAGNLLNDWFDRDWDRRNRPERALPSGSFRPATYLAVAAILGGCALAGSSRLGIAPAMVTLAIALLIVVYTWVHKRSRWAVLPMGLCRGGLYALGFVPFITAFPSEADYTGTFARLSYELEVRSWFMSLAFLCTHALGLLIYIAGLSLAARYESSEHPPHGMVLLSRAMLFLPLAAMSAWWMPYYPLPASLALLPFALWLVLCLTRLRSPVPRFVSALLAGIPLVDFIATLPLVCALGLPDEAIHRQPLLLATVLVPWFAFALGRALQKVAPAT